MLDAVVMPAELLVASVVGTGMVLLPRVDAVVSGEVSRGSEPHSACLADVAPALGYLADGVYGSDCAGGGGGGQRVAGYLLQLEDYWLLGDALEQLSLASVKEGDLCSDGELLWRAAY